MRSFQTVTMILGCVFLPSLSAQENPSHDQSIYELRVERAELLRAAVEDTRQEFIQGLTTLKDVLQVKILFMDASLDLAQNPQEQTDILTAHVELLKEVERDQRSRSEIGVASPKDLLIAKSARLEGEIRLKLHLKKQAEAFKPKATAKVTPYTTSIPVCSKSRLVRRRNCCARRGNR